MLDSVVAVVGVRALSSSLQNAVTLVIPGVLQPALAEFSVLWGRMCPCVPTIPINYGPSLWNQPLGYTPFITF